jgi:hypothetical protein
MSSLPTVDDITPDEFEAGYLSRGQPLRVRNHPTLRDITGKWTLSALAAAHPNHKVQVEHYPEGDPTAPWRYVELELGEYVEKLKNPAERKRHYLAELPLQDILPNVAPAYLPPRFLPPGRSGFTVTFLGFDSFTAPHYHRHCLEAVLNQVVGRKEVLLVPAKAFRSLAPGAWYSSKSNWSLAPISRDTPFVEAAQRWNVDAMHCVLEPGEMLFIPQGWFHAVRGWNESVSVTNFFAGSWRHAHPPILIRDALQRTLHERLGPRLNSALSALGNARARVWRSR